MPAEIIVARGLRSTITLYDGVVMPLFGLGTWRSAPGGETETVTRFALQHGYRLIDTAAVYGNEADVGRAIALSGVPRDEVRGACLRSLVKIDFRPRSRTSGRKVN